MLLSQVVKVKWNSANKKHYTELGYEFTKCKDEFDVKVEHLSCGSHSVVLVQCDYCGNVKESEYRVYLRHRNSTITQKDCCEKCIGKKSNETYFSKNGCSISSGENNIKNIQQYVKNKYGVDNIMHVQEIREKMYNTIVERYGKEYWHNLNKDNQIKIFEKYGKKSISPSGENHPNWKGGLSSENKLGRKTIEYNEWRKNVFKRDKYTCQCCLNSDSGNLVAHHIYGYSKFKDLRYDVNNGVTLCKNCHNEFHNIYGRNGDNTQCDYIEYINNKQILKSETTIETTMIK